VFSTTSQRIVAGVAVAGLLGASFLFGYGVGRSSPHAHDPRYDVLDEVREVVTASAIKDPQDRELLHGAIRGMLGALEDPYVAYLDPESYRSFNEDYAKGQYSGVGLWLTEDEGDMKIISVLEGTPASEAGVQSSDIITAVGSKKVEGLALETVVRRIQGRAGTKVRLKILRGEEKLEFTLVRRNIDYPAVKSRLLGSRTGVIELVSFAGGAGKQVREAVRSLTKKGAKGFVLDLRGNPGGLVSESVEVASVFLDGGKVLSHRQRGRGAVEYATRGQPETKLPLVVLVDERSASASEVVAAAIQDRGRGIIVGTKTYGKGSIQEVFPLEDGSAVKFTIVHYLTPSGRSIEGKGVVPDVDVPSKGDQLSRAEEVLLGFIAEAPRKDTG